MIYKSRKEWQRSGYSAIAVYSEGPQCTLVGKRMFRYLVTAYNSGWMVISLTTADGFVYRQDTPSELLSYWGLVQEESEVLVGLVR